MSPSIPKKLRVLVVEDEGAVAMLIEDMLLEIGHCVAAIAASLSDAIEMARHGQFDIAVLDINLNGALSYPVAEILRTRNVPFVFATGYGSRGIEPRFNGTRILAKPFAADELERVLSEIG